MRARYMVCMDNILMNFILWCQSSKVLLHDERCVNVLLLITYIQVYLTLCVKLLGLQMCARIHPVSSLTYDV